MAKTLGLHREMLAKMWSIDDDGEGHDNMGHSPIATDAARQNWEIVHGFPADKLFRWTSYTKEMQMQKIHAFRASAVAAAIALVAIAGCVTSHVMIGRARPPISPDQVQVYLHPPAGKYEEIALLDTSSRNSFSITAQGKTNAVMQRLKAEAASLGANGVLLNGVGDQAAGSVSTGFGSATASGHSAFGVGIGSSATTYQKKGDGLAIYVEPEQIASR